MDEQAAAPEPPTMKTWWRYVNWWLLLIGPAAVGASIALSVVYDGFMRLQSDLEVPAPYLPAGAAVIYAIGFGRTRNPLLGLLATLAVALSIREFHFDWAGKGIYVMLAALGVWAVLWRSRLAGPLTDWRHTSWLLATMAAYVLSQVIARRAFRFVPGEQVIHRPLEECAETAAHLMLIVTSLLGSLRRKT